MSARGARGFTMVELMIAVFIGMFTLLAVAQVLAFVEGQKRSVVYGSEAQVGGTLALDQIGRDILQSGYGLVTFGAAAGCPIAASFNGAPVDGFPARLGPITITADPTGGPDTIRVLRSGKTSFSVPIPVVAPGYTPGTGFVVSHTLGVKGDATDGDLMLAVSGADTTCELFQVNAAVSTAKLVPRVDDAGWNAPGKPALPYSDGSTLVNLGTLVDQTYAIANGALMVRQLSSGGGAAPAYAAAAELVPGIVSLKALYGKDTNADGKIDTWDTTVPTTSAQWQTVVAVRLAVVARSTQFERIQKPEDMPTKANLEWHMGSDTVNGAVLPACSSGGGGCLPIKLDHLPDWKRYRYKLFEAVVPVRNAIWSRS
ncbi:PilW family protein [Ramlibacter humi]|uniref:PilW family protein n=1 Tax=Ramlibacter humi TaxID=2530451 RepID=UPI00143209CC|nr:PilW family protein [Ramlibacter humi]